MRKYNIRFRSTYDGLATYRATHPDRPYPITIYHRYNNADIAPDGAPLNTVYVYNGSADLLGEIYQSFVSYLDAQWAEAERRAKAYRIDLSPRDPNPAPIAWDGKNWQPIH